MTPAERLCLVAITRSLACLLSLEADPADVEAVAQREEVLVGCRRWLTMAAQALEDEPV